LSDRFLRRDPPGKQETRRLKDYAAKNLARAEIPELREDEILIGTGGTIRNLGKIDTRLRGYPITRLHGYILTAGRTRGLSALFCSQRASARAALPGLNASRADSIAGGSLLAEVVMEHVGAGRMLVAGLGLREGVILEALGVDLPEPQSVRASAIRALVSRFTSWDERRARRRVKIVETLASTLFPPERPFQREMLLHAAAILDVGRSVEYYRRHEHASMILRSAGLNGFGHREILYLSLIIEVAEHFEWKERSYKPLLRNGDLVEIARSAVLLSIADEIEHRIPANRAPRIRCQLAGDSVVLSEPALAAWDPGSIGDAFARSFGRALRVSGRARSN
jgi:exopolyphosphatase/guanosine-5'-triphosphate,3'-diphosphate pyrophosphatase